MAYLELKKLWKRFGPTVAVADMSLEVSKAEFVSLLGPSGCGKTTTLRLVAGLAVADSGEILLEGEAITGLAVHLRGMGMVFQTWALFPNMTTAQNVGFPLRVQNAPRQEIGRRVAEIVELVGLKGFERRYPHELSGGQQQRVALGRALARDPRVLLLDEPLSALDAPIRRSLIVEIRRLQQQLGITTLYVTHDQEEALSMSDRVVVMNQARIVEIGTPEKLYHCPESAFSASFIGATNIFVAEVVDEERALVKIGSLRLPVEGLKGAPRGEKVKVSVRPEDIRVEQERQSAAAPYKVCARVIVKYFLGASTRINVACGEIQFKVDVPSVAAQRIAGGEELWLSFPSPCRLIERAR